MLVAAAQVVSGTTGFVYDNRYLRHDTGPGHPERPERLTAILDQLKTTGLYEQLVCIKPYPCAKQWILAVHSDSYLRHVASVCAGGGPYLDSRDTPVSKESYECALLAAGGVLAAVDAVMDRRVRNAFCAVRPPGHHASQDRAMGFCLFNNVAIAARYIQSKYRLKKILIVDWDVHHGNGTQDIFYSDPTVFYFSIHQHPFYPGSGMASERGSGDAEGTKLNAPMPRGSGGLAYRTVFEKTLKPAALAFKPDFVLVSAGFDAHSDDPLGGMNLAGDDFGSLTRMVRNIAGTCCGDRLVLVLEGGYNLQGLSRSVEMVIREIMR